MTKSPPLLALCEEMLKKKHITDLTWAKLLNIRQDYQTSEAEDHR